jgi:hypothetical protein
MRLLILTAFALMMTGCGDVKRSTVTGTIKFRGKPLKDAAVVFLASDNRTHALILDSEGKYKVDAVARGTIRVVVQPEPESAATSRPMTLRASPEAKDSRLATETPPAIKKGPPIPVKYANADTSGLSFELLEPTQDWSIDIQ